jgi:hypothetical protein
MTDDLQHYGISTPPEEFRAAAIELGIIDHAGEVDAIVTAKVMQRWLEKQHPEMVNPWQSAEWGSELGVSKRSDELTAEEIELLNELNGSWIKGKKE